MAKVLLVDDDVAILKLGEAILGKFGFSVMTSDNVIDAIEKAKNSDFDLILTDANMPRFSGFDLVRTLRSESKFKNLTIAMLTGRKDKEDIKKAIGLGVDDYIIKPIQPDIFVQKVRSLIDRKTQASKTLKSKHISYQLNEKGILQLDIHITQIDEKGIMFLSPQFFDQGLTLALGSALLSEQGIQIPPVKIDKCTPVFKNGQELFEAKTVYCGATESFRKKLNEWIEQQNINQQAA